MDAWLQRIWYQRSMWVLILAPLSLLFRAIVALRRLTFRIGLLEAVRIGRPVVVVGNITVGGTGKTPLVIWLAHELARRGFKPGIITRGYGGSSPLWPLRVEKNSDPRLAGDEAVLLAERTDAIVIAGPDRVADAQQAIALGADVIISDDGLQHYRLARDFEILVVDGARGFGNGYLLPAGPLREPIKRLDEVQARVVTQRGSSKAVIATVPTKIGEQLGLEAHTRLRTARSLQKGEVRLLSSFAGQAVHAIAGIGNPAAFFAGLTEHGMQVDGRGLKDHAVITAADLHFADDAPVFMTEKDAVKCRSMGDARMWVVPIELVIDNSELLIAKIEAVIRAKQAVS